jgi:hypothetical protein
MREIFKYQKGKDFYCDSLEYFEYDPQNYDEKDADDDYIMDDDEIGYHVSKKLDKMGL